MSELDQKSIFSKRLKSLRNKRGLSQKELGDIYADKLNSLDPSKERGSQAEQTIQKWENLDNPRYGNSRLPTGKKERIKLTALAAALECDPLYLLGELEDPTEEERQRRIKEEHAQKTDLYVRLLLDNNAAMETLLRLSGIKYMPLIGLTENTDDVSNLSHNYLIMDGKTCHIREADVSSFIQDAAEYIKFLVFKYRKDGFPHGAAAATDFIKERFAEEEEQNYGEKEV